ncbi:unnamed protein product [Mytilus edulis]|uniref:Uncharacterized protein n=1 Tax=Mytilus edulis TaxID=6550 RepID=A0A8S3QFE2_MYTED|nr:unnamed protein product [Mytilus edulis]
MWVVNEILFKIEKVEVEITIQGNGFSAVGEVKDDNQDDKRCFIKSNTKVICKSPKYIESDFQRRKRSPGQPFFVSFDNYVVSIIMFYVDDPVFEKLPDQTLGKDFSIVIKVEVGSIKLNVGRIHYPTSDTANHESVLYGVIGCLPDRSENMRLGDDGIEQIELTEAENSEVILDEASASGTRINNYEDLGQRSSNNPYCQIQQASAEYQMQDMTGLDNRTRDLSPTEYINLQV